MKVLGIDDGGLSLTVERGGAPTGLVHVPSTPAAADTNVTLAEWVVNATGNLALVPLSSGGVVAGTGIVVSCGSGFRISSHSSTASSSESTSCFPNCSFAPSISCLPVECPASSILNISNAHVSNSSQLAGRVWKQDSSSPKIYFGEILNVTCNSGFMLASSPSGAMNRWFLIGCNDSGVLEGPVESCVPECDLGYRQCGPFNRSLWGQSFGEDGQYLNFSDTLPVHGDALDLHCAYGHRTTLVTESHTQCSGNMSMTAECRNCAYTSPLRCKTVQCDAIENVSTISQGPVTHNSFGTFACQIGYRAKAAGSLPPSCDEPSSFPVKCMDCQYLTNATQCSRIQCDLSAVISSQGVAALLPPLSPNRKYVLYQDKILVVVYGWLSGAQRDGQF